MRRREQLEQLQAALEDGEEQKNIAITKFHVSVEERQIAATLAVYYLLRGLMEAAREELVDEP